MRRSFEESIYSSPAPLTTLRLYTLLSLYSIWRSPLVHTLVTPSGVAPTQISISNTHLGTSLQLEWPLLNTHLGTAPHLEYSAAPTHKHRECSVAPTQYTPWRVYPSRPALSPSAPKSKQALLRVILLRRVGSANRRWS